VAEVTSHSVKYFSPVVRMRTSFDASAARLPNGSNPTNASMSPRTMPVTISAAWRLTRSTSLSSTPAELRATTTLMWL